MTVCGLHDRFKYWQVFNQCFLPQVLHNMALAEAQLGNWEKAQVNLVKALDYKTESKLNMIDIALQSTLVSSTLY